MKEDVLKALNEQLQGVIMGEKEFLKLIKKANEEKLVDLLNESLKIIEKHKRFLIGEISNSDYKVAKDEGMFGKVIEGFTSITNLTINKDKEVIKETIKGLNMGVKSIEDLFKSFECDLNEDIKGNLLNILEQYSNNINEYEKLL